MTQPVAFPAYRHFQHPRVRNMKMEHRLVVLPDFQGLSIGARMSEWVAQHLAEQGYRYRSVSSHPALISYRDRSSRWLDRHGCLLSVSRLKRSRCRRELAANLRSTCHAAPTAPACRNVPLRRRAKATAPILAPPSCRVPGKCGATALQKPSGETGEPRPGQPTGRPISPPHRHRPPLAKREE
ncbi:hypothetical protein [Nonomuraea sp. NPDC049480]|uniref:hypothetical protein n=1 Tax=Nonomuraea sp. NPDC049480 TaxID=3364353 RepID=UPI00378C1518